MRSLGVVAGSTRLCKGRSTFGKSQHVKKCSVRQVNMTISLAFLAPDLVRAAVEGRLPRGISVERLRDAPAEWSRQFETLRLNPQYPNISRRPQIRTPQQKQS